MSSLRLLADVHISPLITLSNYGLPSLITLRLSSAKPDVISKKLIDILPTIETNLKEGALITINDDSVRIRKLPLRQSET